MLVLPPFVLLVALQLVQNTEPFEKQDQHFRAVQLEAKKSEERQAPPWQEQTQLRQ